MTVSTALLDRLRELRAKATPGPWEACFRFGQRTTINGRQRYPICDTGTAPRAQANVPRDEANAALIVELVNNAEALIAAAGAWRPIADAPRDGTHIIACIANYSFGYRDGKLLPPMQTVVHWFAHDGDEGFYTSVNELEPQHPFQATHWMPCFPAPPTAEAK